MSYWLTIINIIFWVFAFRFVKNFVTELLKPPKQFSKPLKTDWEKDVVYLYQFPFNRNATNPSPFAWKVEIYLKSNKIAHEIIPSFTNRSEHGLIPFIELNGKQYADSQFILLMLEEHFNLKDETPSEVATSRLIDRMTDTEVFACANMDRICFHPFEMVEVMIDGKLPTILKYLFGPIMKYRVKERLIQDGIARRTKEEIYEIYEKDLTAIDTYLKLRNSSGGLNIAKAAIFGHLAVVVCCPYQIKGKELIDSKMKWKYLLIAALVVALVVETDASKKRKKNRDDDSPKNEDDAIEGKLARETMMTETRKKVENLNLLVKLDRIRMKTHLPKNLTKKMGKPKTEQRLKSPENAVMVMILKS
ncbi:hypothetical protein FO519_006052 [Halicephalobus sp. NKZ332]|nr:hypothetical protein FO519_006052 [Halicephalobus sp. NKZ332]